MTSQRSLEGQSFLVQRAGAVSQWWSGSGGQLSQFLNWVGHADLQGDSTTEDGSIAQYSQYGEQYGQYFVGLVNALGQAATAFAAATSSAETTLSDALADTVRGFYHGDGGSDPGVQGALADYSSATNDAEKTYRDALNEARWKLDRGEIDEAEFTSLLTAATNTRRTTLDTAELAYNKALRAAEDNAEVAAAQADKQYQQSSFTAIGGAPVIAEQGQPQNAAGYLLEQGQVVRHGGFIAARETAYRQFAENESTAHHDLLRALATLDFGDGATGTRRVEQHSFLKQTKRVVIDTGKSFPSRRIEREGENKSRLSDDVDSGTLLSAESEDFVRLNRLADELINNWGHGSVNGAATIDGIDFDFSNYRGKGVWGLFGRAFTFGTTPDNRPEVRYPTIEQIVYLPQEQITNVTLSTVRGRGK